MVNRVTEGGQSEFMSCCLVVRVWFNQCFLAKVDANMVFKFSADSFFGLVNSLSGSGGTHAGARYSIIARSWNVFRMPLTDPSLK
jgi:hypothetical protein